MAGVTDSGFFKIFLKRAFYILGGYSLDEATMSASREMVKRGRKEFISDDIFSLIRVRAPESFGQRRCNRY